jgi:hypothetical protein
MKPHFTILLSMVLLFCGSAAAESSPAEMISDFRMKHGERRVTMDPTLSRIALEQAKAMAAKDTLDHEVLGPFGSRIGPARSGRAAENIAYGKILPTDMIVLKKRSIGGLPLQDIERISCSAMHPASVSPAQGALALIASIGQWRSRTKLNRCGELQARERRLQQNKNHLHSLAA